MDAGQAKPNPVEQEEHNIEGVLAKVEHLKKQVERQGHIIERLRELIENCHAKVCDDMASSPTTSTL